MIGGDQQENIFYYLQARQDQNDSPYLVNGTLGVFNLDVYALLGLGDNI